MMDEEMRPAAEASQQAADRRVPGLLEATWRYRRMSAAIVGLGLVLSLGLSFLVAELRSERFVATARLALTDPRGSNVFRQGSSAGADLVRYVGERAAFAESDEVLALAAESLGPGFNSRRLREQTSITPFQEQNLIAISATARQPGLATRIANAVADAYREASATETRLAADEALAGVELAKERLLATLRAPDSPSSSSSASVERTAASQALALLEQRASDVAINASLFGDGVNFADPAISARPVSVTSKARNVAAGGLLAVLIAVVLSWIRADRYQTADDGDVPATVLEAPLLGQVPALLSSAEERQLRRLRAMPADAYQFAAAALQSTMASGVLLVTSSTQGEGKTVTAASLAVAAALQGRRVVLIDGDAGNRGLTALMGGTAIRDTMPGLVDLALGHADPLSAVATLRLKSSAQLSFIPAGQSADDVASLYRGEETAKALRRLRTEYELLIIDSPALLDGAYAASLIPHTDGILMVVQRGTPVTLLHAARKRLDLFGVELLGYVFTPSRRASGPKGAARFRLRSKTGSRQRTSTS